MRILNGILALMINNWGKQSYMCENFKSINAKSFFQTRTTVLDNQREGQRTHDVLSSDGQGLHMHYMSAVRCDEKCVLLPAFDMSII